MDIEVKTPFFSLGIEESIYYEEDETLQYNEHSKYKYVLVIDNYVKTYNFNSVEDLKKLKSRIDILIDFMEKAYGK